MKKIAFVITNPIHHWEMVQPILNELLKKPSISIVLVSFCELRRMKSPVEDFIKMGVEYRIMPGFSGTGLKPSSGNWILGRTTGRLRKWAQWITWHLLLKNPFRESIKVCSEVIVLNDAAFPGNYIAGEVRKKNMKLSLLQEGIRFSLPNETYGGDIYGTNADRIFTWGRKSKDYFSGIIRKQGVEIIVAGCPRIDMKLRENTTPNNKEPKWRKDKHKKNLILFSNPIDDMGYLSEIEKWDLIADFFEKGAPILEKFQIEPAIKLHPRENHDHLLTVLENRKLNGRIKLIQGEIYSILKKTDYSIVLASTVGLESLLSNVPLGVIAIPGYGFAFDYVEYGVGVPLDLSAGDFCDRLTDLFNKSSIDTGQKRYITDHFANKGTSASVIADQLSEK